MVDVIGLIQSTGKPIALVKTCNSFGIFLNATHGWERLDPASITRVFFKALLLDNGTEQDLAWIFEHGHGQAGDRAIWESAIEEYVNDDFEDEDPE